MRLACITVPNFRIALERTRALELRGQPLAIGEPPPGENQVIDCSPEAAVLGVRSGMPLRDARTLAPDLILLPPDPIFYDRAAEALLNALHQAEPFIEPGGDGIAYAALDPHANADAEQRTAVRLLAAVQSSSGVIATAGIGEGKFIATCAAATSAPDKVVIVPPGDEAAFIAPLSTALLPVSYEAQRKFAIYALRTIGEVARLPFGAAQAQFGREGKRLWELANGIDATPFLPRAHREQVAGTLQMPAPTVNAPALGIAARQLTGRLMQHPSMRYRQVRQIRLSLTLLDGGSWARTLTLREPLASEQDIVFVLHKLIEPLQLSGPVEEMTLEFIGLTGETGKQRSLLFADQARRHAQLLATLRHLKTRFGGEAQVSKIVEVEPWSRIPERRYALIDYDL